MANLTQYKALLAERASNEKSIVKMTRRNKEIDRIMSAVSQLFKGKPNSSPEKDPETPKKERVITRSGIGNKILGVFTSLEPLTIYQIAHTLYGERTTKEDVEAVASRCSYLTKKGQLVRTALSTYRVKGLKGNTPQSSTISLGHDTRVTQVPGTERGN